MALIRWQPRDSFALQNEIDSMVNRFWGDFAPERHNGWSPKVDLMETDEGFEMQVELPGMKREDVKVSYEDNVLMISGERKRDDETTGKTYYRRERSFGSFKRSFRMGTEIHVDGIHAEFNDGVLHVTLPKSEAVKPRQIEVKVS